MIILQQGKNQVAIDCEAGQRIVIACLEAPNKALETVNIKGNTSLATRSQMFQACRQVSAYLSI